MPPVTDLHYIYAAELLIGCMMFLGLASAAGRARLYLIGLPAFFGAGEMLNLAWQQRWLSVPAAVGVGLAAVAVGTLAQLPRPRVPADVSLLLGLIILEASRRAAEAVVGPQGRSGLWQPSLGRLSGPRAVLLIAAGCLAACLAGYAATGTAPWRSRWAALAAAEPSLASASGVEPAALRFLAGSAACLQAGVAGLLWSWLHGSVSTSQLDADQAVLMFALTFVGGLSAAGAMASAVVYVAAPVLLRELRVTRTETEAALVRNLVFGLALIAVIRFAPAGLFGRPFRLDAEADRDAQ